MKKFIKMTLLSLLGIILISGVCIFLFMQFHPVFGGKASEIQKQHYTQSGHFEKGVFKNLVETNMDMNFGEMMKLLPEYFKQNTNREPKVNIPVEKIDSLDIQNHIGEATRLTWFGHSAFLLEIDGKKILIDPMFGDTPSPVVFLGKKRYSKELPLAIEKIPEIDLVIFSHDHYDHLDHGSILKLKSKVKMFYTPLGVGNHLKRWGVDENKIREFNWLEEAQFQGLQIACTPARHFSGRGFGDRFTTLWASWTIKGNEDNLYFSGDSGYGPHFKEIGEKYGPFTFAMMECGQYNERWANIHMMPEETIQASKDIKAARMMPIHWGAFTLALHSWTEPVERAEKEAEKLGVEMITPKIGEALELNKTQLPKEKWWRAFI